MKKREDIITRLVESEDISPSQHHFYLTGKSVVALETYGINLVEQIEKISKMNFKGIVKHFSILMPYFDDAKGADKFINQLKESVSIAKDCYDEYAGFIVIECDKDWENFGANEYITPVLEYIKSLIMVRFVVLFPYITKKGSELFNALSTIGVWANVEIEDIEIREYMESWKKKINIAGFQISEQNQEELCLTLEKRQSEIIDMDTMLTRWLSQVCLNRSIAENSSKEIGLEDIQLLSGITLKKGNYTIGFGSGR